MLRSFLFNKNNFFSDTLPPLRRKRSAFEIEDLPGLWRIHWQRGDKILWSTFYTRIDQACLLWGIISVVIFSTAQFLPIDWSMQAIVWSVLTGVGVAAMVERSRHWYSIEPIAQVIEGWVWLMSVGLVLTDLSIFLQWGLLLSQLCTLWVGLSALGYFYSGWKLRSRAFNVVGLLHLLGIALLPYAGIWQFGATGLLLGVSAILLAELQWDSHDVCAHISHQHPKPQNPKPQRSESEF